MLGEETRIILDWSNRFSPRRTISSAACNVAPPCTGRMRSLPWRFPIRSLWNSRREIDPQQSNCPHDSGLGRCFVSSTATTSSASISSRSPQRSSFLLFVNEISQDRGGRDCASKYSATCSAGQTASKASGTAILPSSETTSPKCVKRSGASLSTSSHDSSTIVAQTPSRELSLRYHVRQEAIRGSSILDRRLGIQPLEHRLACKLSYAFQEPLIGWRCFWILDLHPRRVLDKRRVAGKRQIGFDAGWQHHIKTARGPQHNFHLARGKSHFLIGTEQTLLANLCQCIFREDFQR